MKTFYLKSGKDVVNKVSAKDIQSAIEYFAKVKKLQESELLKIFKVTE